MQPYLVRRQGDVVAAACAAASGPLLRLKNVVVDPAHRRRGVATALAVRFAGLAAELGFSATGCFAIEGEVAMGIYVRAGYREATSQVEWMLELGSGSGSHA
jgi:predicted GNAT family acetyltransferase